MDLKHEKFSFLCVFEAINRGCTFKIYDKTSKYCNIKDVDSIWFLNNSDAGSPYIIEDIDKFSNKLHETFNVLLEIYCTWTNEGICFAYLGHSVWMPFKRRDLTLLNQNNLKKPYNIFFIKIKYYFHNRYACSLLELFPWQL